MLYNLAHALVVNVDRVGQGPVEVGDFLFWLVIFFGLVLIETSDLIAKGFIFEVSS